MATNYFPGLRSIDDFATNEVPQSWREGIMRRYPSGDLTITGLTARMKSRKESSRQFNWWEKSLPQQRAAVTGVYIDAGLGTAYVYATHQATRGIAGGTVYVKMVEASAKQFIAGQLVLLRDADRSDVDLRAKVTGREFNGASSYVAVRLLQADTNSAVAATYNLASVDTALVIGSVHPEGSNMPTAMATDPTQYYNYMQIMRNSLGLTRSAWQEKLRTVKDPLKEARFEALEFHGIEMEKNFIWGVRTSGTGDNNEPEHSMMGLIEYINTYASANMDDYRLNTDTAYASKTWEAGGFDWLEEKLELIFRHGKDTKMAICGSGAVMGINKLAKTYGTINLEVGDMGFGLKVKEWMTPFGTILLKTHPLFSYEATNRNAMLIFEPDNIEYVYKQDTMLQEDMSFKKGGFGSRDRIDEGYLTECSLEMHYPDTYGYLDGVGQDNTQ